MEMFWNPLCAYLGCVASGPFPGWTQRQDPPPLLSAPGQASGDWPSYLAGPHTGKTEGAAVFLPGTHHLLSRPVIIKKFIYQLCIQHAFIKRPQYQALHYTSQTWLVFVELQSGGGAVASPQRSSSVVGVGGTW